MTKKGHTKGIIPFLKELWIYPTAYVLAQLATGMEAGVAAATLMLIWGWSFAESLGTTVAIGYPISFAQVFVFALILRSNHRRRLQQRLAWVGATEVGG